MRSSREVGAVLRFFFCVLTLTLGFAARAVAAPVARVLIEGNKRVEAGAIRARMHVKEGTPYDVDKVRSDIRAIFGLGQFDTVEADEESTPAGVVLRFRVHEKPMIVKVELVGIDEINEDERKDVIEVHEFEALDVPKMNRTVEKLEAKYEEKGHYLADVRYDVKIEPTKNEAVVTFRVQENDKVSVKKITFLGNKVATDDELKRMMQTREGGLFSFLSGSGSYREAMFERDVAALGYYYGTRGYVRARVDKPQVTVSPDKKGIYITIAVEEGEQYRVGKVDFSGDLLFNRRDLEENNELVTGEIFNTETLRRETLRFTEKYGDLGFAFANVVPQPNIHDDTRTVDITFEIEPGDRVFIGKIFITGNTRTKDKVIRRELRIVEGELYNETRKRLSRENVLRLGFFDSVEFHQSTSKTSSSLVEIEIRVKERSTGQLVLGAGYASGNIGFTAQAQLSQNNFMGNGQVASLSAQILTGQRLYELNVGFQEPYVGYSNWSLGGDVYHIRRNVLTQGVVRTFEETKTGFDVKLGHPVLEFTNLFLSYKMETLTVPTQSIIDQSLIPPNSVNGLASSMTGSILYDKRDDRFDPRNGLLLSASTEFAGVGGVRKFLRTRGTMKFFYPLFWDFVFRFHTTAATIAPVGSNPVPVNELFIQGGLFSLRGYDFLSIGPRRTLSNNSADLSKDAVDAGLQGKPFVLGGRNEVLANAEIEFPLLQEAKIRGVVFFDAGNAFDGNLLKQVPTLYTNIGWGFRWFTPIGPLRFEFGYPVFQDGPSRFFFTIGPPF